MTTHATKTLFYAAETLNVAEDARVLFLYADMQGAPNWLSNANITTYQPLAGIIRDPDADTPDNLPSDEYDLVLILSPKNKIETRALIGYGATHLNKNGYMIVCAANDAGGKSLAKEIKPLNLPLENVTKNKCRAVICTYEKDFNADLAKQWATNLQSIDVPETDFKSYPGLYGWRKVDEGSRRLVAHLPDAFTGVAADFGCGYGYLTRYIAQHSHADTTIIAIDNDARACQVLGENASHPNLQSLWADMRDPISELPLCDVIVMNPPFHAGKTPDLSLGRIFIERAAQALKNGGVLYMVANQHLAYEKTLRHHFSSGDCLSEEAGFKIFKAVK